MTVQRALLSVADKTNLATFAQGLAALGVELISTGGTAEVLRQAGLSVTTVETLTHYPALAGGRVKTLHPAVHSAILALRDNETHMTELASQRMAAIDLVVVNLYPFETVVRQPQVTLEAAIEQIDIGGVALLRAAAKNHRWVGVVCDPSQYERVLEELRSHERQLSDATRRALAVEAFARTARYDLAIQQYLDAHGTAPTTLPAQLTCTFTQVRPLRYGENPHQQAAWYRLVDQPTTGLLAATPIGGKELSYNNLLDASAALATAWEFAAPTACIIKHLSPCGVASHAELTTAYTQAMACDALSAFGGIVGLNRPLDAATATAMAAAEFLEVIVAPHITAEAATVLAVKKNLRILEVPDLPPPGNGLATTPWELRTIAGGILVQTPDTQMLNEQTLRVVTQRAPTNEERVALAFAWRVVKHVRSNAIVVVQGTQTVGIGGGCPSRIDAVLEALRKAGDRARGAVLASDAFFPKTDNIEVAAQAGVTAIMQPGGSRRDDDVIAAANRAGLAMLLTGLRHFRH